ncbi:MAG: DUF2357 domain-containing protein [Balneolaceae bacterium]|nr:DUF2357 domain-containing protein [Balneolaceae bacterium]
MAKQEHIELVLSNGDQIKVTILSKNDHALNRITESEAQEHFEAEVQLIEGFSYEYKISSLNYMLSADGNIIQPITSQPSVGLIVPNIYVGKLNISVCDIQTHKKIGSFDLEIRSIKTEYRSEYQFMLEQITEKCSELLLKYDSPVHQHFKIDPQADAQTLYQRFAFLKSVLESEDFEVAIHRITSNPVTNWLQTEDLRDIRAVKKFSRNVIRQLASATNRIAVPSNHTLRNYGLASIPEKVVVQSKIETLDTAENRFIKHALEAFKNLCEDFRTAAKNHSRLFIESGLMIDHLDEYLNHNFFK